MKTTIYRYVLFSAVFLLFTAAADTAYSQEASSKASSENLKLTPSQERIPHIDQPGIPPEYFIPPIESPAYSPAAPVVSGNTQPFKAPLVSRLERGKWYVQLGAYTKADLVDDAVRRAGSGNPVIVHNAGTDANPMFRVMLGPFSQSESKTVLQRFRNKGYDAFLRKGN
jgi:cell division septation protein DedD